ncbi:unnamed protein product [Eruca vesicaria subsp. sativa]|uniref:Cytochrome P450 n=1 Tax=Eruca vesicaria subsp. sativa TaxID=29727 RepID=A0ABC8LMM5_ERUVS|nr:unnamed protein product [Eruca vesicaria subsp. sativa]
MAAMIVEFQNCIFLILLCFFSFLYYFFKKTNDMGPSPPSLPIIGHLHHVLSALPHKAFQKISTKYGPLLHLHIFSFPIFLVSSHSIAYEIFTTHDLNISSRNTAAIDASLLVFGSSGFTVAPYGDYVKYIKKLLATKLFGPRAIEKSRGVRAEELKLFYLRLLKEESIDICKETTKFTNNVICRMSMGRIFSEENGEIETVRELIIKSFGLAKKFLFVNVFRRPLEMLGMVSFFKKDIMDVSNRFDELLERILAEREEKKPEEDQDMDMMDLLLEACRDDNAEYRITRTQIKALFVEIFMGGTDTAAHSTQWTMAELVNNPNIFERLRDEIDGVIGKSRLIQETDLPNLPFLQAVVKEGLRLHPPAPLLVRMLEKKCVIKDFFNVPEKTTLVVNFYALMRDPDSWEDPNEFKPERFLTSKQEEEKALKYLPFSAGRRGCPATNLGYIFVGISVGMMVQCFDWSIKDKVSLEEVYAGMSLAMAHPPKFTPVSRLSL